MARSAFRAEITVMGATATAEKINLMGARAANTLPLMEMIKELLFVQQQRRVQSTPWVPLKEVTIARKMAQGENTAIMRGEWRMIGGQATRIADKLWLAMTLDGATGQIKRATRTTATFGVDSKGNHQLFYARFVQDVKGTKRRLLAISSADAVEILDRVGNWIYVGESALKR